MSFFPRNPLNPEAATTVTQCLQDTLVTLIDLALQGKQAHWNVYGSQFLSVHEKLDEVVASARNGGDTLAERIVQLGRPADGRAGTVSSASPLPAYPDGMQSVPETLTAICDRLKQVSDLMYDAIRTCEEPDPLTGDYLIAINQELNEHLWMLQAMEKSA